MVEAQVTAWYLPPRWLPHEPLAPLGKQACAAGPSRYIPATTSRPTFHLTTARLLSWLLAMSFVSAAAAQERASACRPRTLAFGDKSAGWAPVPLSRLKRDTAYSVMQEDGRAVLRATADGSASLYVARLKPAQRTPMTLGWEWMTDALVPGADNREKSKEDAPLRVLVAFDGDVASLPDAERKRFSRARNIARRELPYAVLMYIWSDHVPEGTVIPSAHTSQVKMLVVASGPGGLGRWRSVERDVAQDYKKAFGSDAGPVLGIAVMTDTDNTGTQAVGNYTGVRIGCP